jgi:hypothetical protein
MEVEEKPKRNTKGKVVEPVAKEVEVIEVESDSFEEQLAKDKALTSIQQKPEAIEVEKSDRDLLAMLEAPPSSAPPPEQGRPKSKRKMEAEKEKEGPQDTRSPLSDEAAVFYFNCRLSLSLKSIYDLSAMDVLFVPFLTSQLELYPGSALRDSLLAPR